MYDFLLYFSRAQAIADLNEVESTKSIDLENVTPKRQVGAGKPMYVEVWGTAASNLSTGTLTIQLMTDSDTTTLNGTLLLEKSGITMPNATSALLWQVALPTSGLLRYVGLTYDAVTTDPAGNLTITAYLTDCPDAVAYYNSGIAVT